jgi:hypothetical protein
MGIAIFPDVSANIPLLGFNADFQAPGIVA